MSPRPFALLQELEQMSQDIQTPATSDKALQYWQGIGFRACDEALILPVLSMVEVLTEPRLTQVPGTPSWCRGLTHVRGQLLAVIDLQGFILGQNLARKQGGQYLVIKKNDKILTLMVERLAGLQSFTSTEGQPVSPGLPSKLKDLVEGQFGMQDKRWHLIQTDRLIDKLNASLNPSFTQG